MKAPYYYLFRPMTSDEEVETFLDVVEPEASRAVRAELYALFIREIMRAHEGSRDAARNLESKIFLEIAKACRVVVDFAGVDRAVQYYAAHRRADRMCRASIGPYVVE